MTWWMARHAQRCGVAWRGDQAMDCCGCGGSGSCGVAWLDALAWVSSKREAVTWSREREQRNEVRERANTIW